MVTPDQKSTDVAQLTGRWKLDPERTAISFQTKAMWVLGVKGTARALDGDAQVSPDGTVNGKLVIDAASLDTKNKKRDDHLRTADFFEVVKYPTIIFTATGAQPASGGRVEITGELTVHGQTRPLTLLTDVSATATSATISTEVDIDRSLWGLSWAKMGAGMKNRVTIRAHFERN
jgi:polyisoprenoid-binding protein YceI